MHITYIKRIIKYHLLTNAQTVKNVGFVVRYEECNKPCLLFAKHKLKDQELTSLKRVLYELVYSSGFSFAENEQEKPKNS